MGVLTEICQCESSHGQQYEIKHIEQIVLHNLVGTYAATVQDDASRNGAGKIAQAEKNQNLRQCSVRYFCSKQVVHNIYCKTKRTSRMTKSPIMTADFKALLNL